MIVNEKQIDTAISFFEASPDHFVTEVGHYVERFPNIMQYMYSDNFGVLDDNERELFEYLTLVLVKAALIATEGAVADPDPDTISEMEEQHWSLIQAKSQGGFREKLTPFFDQYDEEDALAFIEDSIIDDDDFSLVKEIKELFFVGLSTMTLSLLAV